MHERRFQPLGEWRPVVPCFCKDVTQEAEVPFLGRVELLRIHMAVVAMSTRDYYNK